MGDHWRPQDGRNGLVEAEPCTGKDVVTSIRVVLGPDQLQETLVVHVRGGRGVLHAANNKDNRGTSTNGFARPYRPFERRLVMVVVNGGGDSHVRV